MGLFIGASVLTILELFDYLYEVRFITYLYGCSVINISAEICVVTFYSLPKEYFKFCYPHDIHDNPNDFLSSVEHRFFCYITHCNIPSLNTLPFKCLGSIRVVFERN